MGCGGVEGPSQGANLAICSGLGQIGVSHIGPDQIGPNWRSRWGLALFCRPLGWVARLGLLLGW